MTVEPSYHAMLHATMIKKMHFGPSSIYSWSVSHILKRELFCLGRFGSQGSKGKKVDLSFSEQLFRVFFFQLFVDKTMNSKNFENTVGSAVHIYTA